MIYNRKHHISYLNKHYKVSKQYKQNTHCEGGKKESLPKQRRQIVQKKKEKRKIPTFDLAKISHVINEDYIFSGIKVLYS